MNNLSLLINAPIFNIQLLLDGLWIGAIFALAAFGMALVWGVMNIINVAQGEFVILGGFITLLAMQFGLPPLAGIPIAAVVLFILGWGLYRLVIWRIVDADMFISLLATFGISIMLQQLMNEIFGSDVRTAESNLGISYLFDNMVTVPHIKALAFVLAFVIGFGLWLFLKRSRMGQAIRATAQNARAARILGIDTDRVYAATYAINAALCGAAGALVVMAYSIHPYMGLPYTIRSFMIVILAGLGNLVGVIASGLGLGVAEQFAGFLLGTEFQLAFVFLLLVVVLVWRQWRLAQRRQYLK
ncbi:branched-chain amino acid ABC transporter permease [Thermopetrobacter sp. TC1]|uniref:branched-chain amino acid ABC transporter permease n=1 Tax=Thermopetrobacter sp. TC1 TaxID=1495045 RepID=UPI000B2784E9